MIPAQNAPYISSCHLLVSTPRDLAATWSSRIASQERPTLDRNTLSVMKQEHHADDKENEISNIWA